MKSLLISFFSFLKREKIPTKENLIDIKNQPFSFYKGVLLFTCLLVTALFLSLLMSISNKFSVEVPDYGGTLSEGVIGSPRFINPLLATSETDQALTTLVYSGLVKESGEGQLTTVLADRFVVDPMGKEYRFTLKENLKFSDKTPLSSSDILFTFETKKRLSLLSDPNSDWSNIYVETPDEKTVVIKTTGSPKALIEKLSLGIVPKALWGSIDFESIKDSTLNISPTGAGPFALKTINYNNTVPKELILERNNYFAGSKPYIKTIKVHIFANQLDLKDGLQSENINSTAMQSGIFIDSKIQEKFFIQQIPTEKNVSLFVLSAAKGSSASVALASIERFVDRKKIIDIIEKGYGIALYSSLSAPAEGEEAISKLTKLGYKQNESGILTKGGSEITVPIVVRKEEQILGTAQLLSQELASYGILTELKVFDQGLFTDQVGHGGYQFILGTETDIPAGYERLIPLYTKTVPGIAEKYVHTYSPSVLRSRAEVFRDIENWYIRSDKVWKWFN